MEVERGVHAIVPGKSLDFEGFVWARPNATYGTRQRPDCGHRRARSHGELDPDVRMFLFPQIVVIAQGAPRRTHPVTSRSRKVDWDRTRACTI